MLVLVRVRVGSGVGRGVTVGARVVRGLRVVVVAAVATVAVLVLAVVLVAGQPQLCLLQSAALQSASPGVKSGCDPYFWP